MTTTATLILSDIRTDILVADVKLVRRRAGSYVAIDTKTGATIGCANRTEKGRWFLTGGADVADVYMGGWMRAKHQDNATYFGRLATIIPQWARGYC